MRLPTPRKTAQSAILLLAVAVAGCSSTEPRLGLGGIKGIYAANGKTSGREFFSVASVGVAASPRVVGTGSRVPRGGGRDIVGKPYTVKGKTYYPSETPKAVEVGKASWYGAAFHGRLTANGEVYDMAHLTAAHKTFPLPSYARVTNMENGRSLIVRVNDRGPFEDGRVIDLSKRAADLLDYSQHGVAQVKVEYAGRAPLDGQDDAFLMASVQGIPGVSPNGRHIEPGVMVAMNGATPEGRPIQGLPGVRSPQETMTSAFNGETVVRPQPRPAFTALPPAPIPGMRGSVSAYASDRVAAAFSSSPFAGFDSTGWKTR